MLVLAPSATLTLAFRLCLSLRSWLPVHLRLRSPVLVRTRLCFRSRLAFSTRQKSAYVYADIYACALVSRLRRGEHVLPGIRGVAQIPATSRPEQKEKKS